MTRFAARAFGLLSVLLAVQVAGLNAQVRVVPNDREAFLRRALETATRFADPSAAIRAGFRRLGPEFPGMGQHWVHPGRIVSGRIDASSPPVLTYARRNDGKLALLGLAWAVPIASGQAPPAEPFGSDAWHDHTGAVDEEILLLGHVPDEPDAEYRFRLSMVHVWNGLENPDGILAQNNWALPFWRNGLAVPNRVSRSAARALSLARDGREFYRALLERAVELAAEERAHVNRVLDAHAARIEALIERQRARSDVVIDDYEVVWYDMWRAVRELVSAEQWDVLSRFVEA
jgi:hypothetical protein